MTAAIWLARLAVIAALAWLACVLAVSLFQEKLIFHSPPFFPGGVAPEAEEAFLETRDGIRLQGWFVPGTDSGKGAVLYFGGNAEEVSSMTRERARLEGRSLALFNYRGFGNSGGRPGERELFSDALEIFDWLGRRAGVDPGGIVVLGRSLGSGVAVHLAAHRPVQGLVLVSPYESALALARERYPWVPVRLLLRHRFDSGVLAPGIRAPALFLVASGDADIPPRHSRALAARWGGPVSVVEIPGADHNSVGERPDYWEAIRGFLEAF